VLDKTMKLYELRRGSYFRIPEYLEQLWLFEKIDGAYSICYAVSEDRELLDKVPRHFAAWMEVVVETHN
jgi:hypothetical protein